ncbi:MAG: hypothetical protein JWM96_680, partial [Alphaproteobacteria bacterium]|nr:hypothetical protein [Alphaproteobacteria bacterium]
MPGFAKGVKLVYIDGMKNNETELMDYTRYMNAKSLVEALGAYSDLSTLKSYDVNYGMDNGNKSIVAPLVMAIGETRSTLDSLEENQTRLLAELKSQVSELVKSGDLVPAGFRMPRESTSSPQVIPVTLFLDGAVNWDKSEITAEDRAYAAVKLVETEAHKVQANNFQRFGGLAVKVKKSDKQNFAELGPSQNISEKDAASYLGLSVRSLQSLRV